MVVVTVANIKGFQFSLIDSPWEVVFVCSSCDNVIIVFFQFSLIDSSLLT